jgi:hypothetical protein
MEGLLCKGKNLFEPQKKKMLLNVLSQELLKLFVCMYVRKEGNPFEAAAAP